jgi:cytochrome c peroxidase
MRRLAPRTLALVVLLAGCPKHNSKPVEPQPKRDADAGGSAAAVVVPPSPPVPEAPASLPQPPPHDGITPDAVAFGALLFADPALSQDGKTACATCHDPAHGFAGAKVPALVNLAWVRDRDWATYLPKHLADTMHGSVPHTPLYDAYKLDATAALTAYVLTRYEGDSAWDRAERSAAPPADAAAGYKLFTGKAQCAHCHAPPLYTDLAMHDGVRTPSLRGVAKRPVDLAAMIDHPGQSVKVAPVDKSPLVAFLKAL